MLFNKTRIGFIKTLIRMGADIKIINKRKIHNELIADLKIDQKNLNSTIMESDEVPYKQMKYNFIIQLRCKWQTVFKGLKELTVKEVIGFY